MNQPLFDQIFEDTFKVKGYEKNRDFYANTLLYFEGDYPSKGMRSDRENNLDFTSWLRGQMFSESISEGEAVFYLEWSLGRWLFMNARFKDSITIYDFQKHTSIETHTVVDDFRLPYIRSTFVILPRPETTTDSPRFIIRDDKYHDRIAIGEVHNLGYR